PSIYTLSLHDALPISIGNLNSSDWKRLVVLGEVATDDVIICGDCSSDLRTRGAVDWRMGRRRMHRGLCRRRCARPDERKDSGTLDRKSTRLNSSHQII